MKKSMELCYSVLFGAGPTNYSRGVISPLDTDLKVLGSEANLISNNFLFSLFEKSGMSPKTKVEENHCGLVSMGARTPGPCCLSLGDSGTSVLFTRL